MKKLILILATLFSFTGAVSAFTVAQSWQITNKYSIRFSSNEAGGIFKTFKGSIAFDEQNLASSSFSISIDVASINTGNAMMNKHAKSADLFDAAKFPEIKFTSKKIVKSGSGYVVTGDLEIHGIKKEISFPFSFQKSTFSGAFSVNRSDFKIGKPGGEVSEAIKIEVSVPVTKK